MRILLQTHEYLPFRGGVATYVHQLATAAAELGHHIRVQAPRYPDMPANLDANLPFEVERFPMSFKARKYAGIMSRTWRQAGRREFDLIHAADFTHHVCTSAVARLRRLPLACTLHGTDVLLGRQVLHARLLAGADIYARAQHLYANSRFTRDLLLKQYPQIEPARVAITPLGVDPIWFTEPDLEVRQRMRERFGLASFDHRIITVARLDIRKGHRLVLQALALLPPQLQRRTLYICVGQSIDESYRAQLLKQAESCGVKVVFTGSMAGEELRALVRECDFCCMPGEPRPDRVEGFGLAFLEAAAQGLPAVASAVDAIPEVVLEGQTGLLTPARDTQALALAMRRLLEDDALRETLGEAARLHAAKYTWQRCAELTYGRA